VEASNSSVCVYISPFISHLIIILVSGGFATVQPNSELSINAVEGYPLEDFSAEAVRSQISEAQKIANGSGSEQDIAEAKIELEVSKN
jgi:F-type H+-transporting ATPase subunit delta